MAIPLTAHEATITTATVEIRQLRVSGKQVTLAVFRQLEAEGIMDWDTGSFRGLPWGWVNYHPEKTVCQYLRDHRHIVWQRGDELRSDTLSRLDLSRPHPRTCPYPDAAIDCYAAWLAITPRARVAAMALPIGWQVAVPTNDAETLGHVTFGDVDLRYALPSPTGREAAYQAAWEQVEAEHPDIAAFAHRWRERDAAVDAAQRAIMAADLRRDRDRLPGRGVRPHRRRHPDRDLRRDRTGRDDRPAPAVG
jgi:hypothetical protein